jgi:preprotein translocase subunit SecG
MDTMQSIVLIGHTFIAIMIIVLVLMQRGKGADAGAAFGSGASGTVFGARGSASFFSRATAVLATAFFATSLALAYMSSQRVDAPESLLEATPDAVIEQPEQAPAANEEAELPVLEENLEQLTGEDELPELGDDERNPQ